MPNKVRLDYEKLPYPTVVVVGGGFAGLEVVRRLANKPFKVLLIDRQNHHCFQPLLYQVATASLSADSIAHPFRRTVSPMPNVAFRMGSVHAVRPAEKVVETDHGDVRYDILVLATGSATNFFGNAQVEDQAMQLKTISQALDIRSDFLQDFEAALYLSDENAQRRQLNFVIVGGGPTGVELAGAMAEIRMTVLKNEYREMENDRMQIHLIDSNTSVLRSFSEKSQARALAYLKSMGVKVNFGMRVMGFDGDRVTFQDGSSMDTNTVIWAAGVKGTCVPGLEAGFDPRSNRYLVDGFNKVQGTDHVYALGDIALMSADPAWPKGHPQVAPAAIQQGRHLVRNLLRKEADRSTFRYRDRGSMATIGRYKAVFDSGRFHLSGPIAWFGWLFVHLMSLVSFRNRVMVLFNWAWKYMSWKNTIRLIIRPYIRSTTSTEQRASAVP
ncbi:MAG TPA: NAD(P)/FAD-dependent oxidoreductase [Flavobacteriales bacterium]|nr:NAD(P)/FAD-dependent oxidoreductase [Flavobacteriales bacterium]